MAAFARLFNDERHASTPAEASDPTEDTADNQEFDSSVPRYHDYQVSTPICDAAQQFGCTAEYVFSEGLSRYPAPGLDGSYVRNQEIRELPAFGKTQFLVDRNNFKIRNVTLPGHLLHPGYVERQVITNGTRVFIRTHGVGTGRFGFLNTAAASVLWTSVDAQIARSLIGVYPKTIIVP
jgi:hypothetical protein